MQTSGDNSTGSLSSRHLEVRFARRTEEERLAEATDLSPSPSYPAASVRNTPTFLASSPGASTGVSAINAAC